MVGTPVEPDDVEMKITSSSGTAPVSYTHLFYKSPQIWRINHYRFFHLPTDRSGFYTYIKDGKDYWCPTAEPAKTRKQSWKETHGMGYTVYDAKRRGLAVKATYFVGEYENCLIWNLRIRSNTAVSYTHLDVYKRQRSRKRAACKSIEQEMEKVN